MEKIKDYIWDKLFLDFYLNNNYSLRFRLLNFLSGDILRSNLSSVTYHIKRTHQLCKDAVEPDPLIELHIRKSLERIEDLWDI